MARMAACGQISTHLLHWMQIEESQTGISAARLRFSHLAVAVGHVPSTGLAETGRRSPLPRAIVPMTRWTKSGAAGEIHEFSMEKRYIRSDGSILWAHVTVTMIRNREGAPVCAAGFLRDDAWLVVVLLSGQQVVTCEDAHHAPGPDLGRAAPRCSRRTRARFREATGKLAQLH